MKTPEQLREDMNVAQGILDAADAHDNRDRSAPVEHVRDWKWNFSIHSVLPIPTPTSPFRPASEPD
jgi:hypothetical protein